MRRLTTILVVGAVVWACSKNQQLLEPPSSISMEGDAPSEPVALGDSTSSTSQVIIAQSILEACGMSEAVAFFEYDSARVLPVAGLALQQLADCFNSGPLKGKTMRLVGHADPRGSEEYNMVLGNRRAESVKTALTALGLSGNAITTSSRGETEAVGTDAETWSHDRRVEVTIGGSARRTRYAAQRHRTHFR